MRLSPRDPEVFNAYLALGQACLFLGRYDEASSWAERAVRAQPDLLSTLRVAAACHAHAGRLELAGKAVVRLRQLDPVFGVSKLEEVFANSYRRPEDMARYVEGLRKAGLPE
jgi:tetratricopeptide (TPR) repeat protein